MFYLIKIILIIVCIEKYASSQPFEQINSIPVASNIMQFAVNQEGTRLGICMYTSNDFSIFTYNTAVGQHELTDVETQNPFWCRSTKMTADGQWMIMADQNWVSIIYHYNSALGQFQQHQPNLDHATDAKLWACTISEDHKYAIIANIQGNVFIYEYNISGTGLFENKEQETQNMGRINNIIITDNNQFFVYSSVIDFPGIVIYKNDGSNFTHHQTIPMTTVGSFEVEFSHGDQYIAVSIRNQQKFQIYKLNPVNQMFELTNIGNALTYPSDVTKTIFYNNKIIVCTYSHGVYVYTLDFNTLTLTQIQHIPNYISYDAYISRDLHYLFFPYYENPQFTFRVFKNCNFETYGVILDSNQQCFSCGDGCIDCDETLGCQMCNSGYSLNTLLHTCDLIIQPTPTPIPIPSPKPSQEQQTCNIALCEKCENSTHCSVCYNQIMTENIQGQCCDVISSCHSYFPVFILVVILVIGLIIVIIIAILYYGGCLLCLNFRKVNPDNKVLPKNNSEKNENQQTFENILNQIANKIQLELSEEEESAEPKKPQAIRKQKQRKRRRPFNIKINQYVESFETIQIS